MAEAPHAIAAKGYALRILKRLLGVVHIVLAVVVGVNWIATPIYHDGSIDYPVWMFLSFFMAPAVLIALIVNFLSKRALDREESDGALTRQYFEVNLAFYASIVLALWYYWNFFGTLFPETESAAVGLIHLEMWTFIDVLFVLVVGVTGFRLWRMAAMR